MEDRSQRNRAIWIIGFVGGVFLFFIVGALGYALGRAAIPTPEVVVEPGETIVEIQEVTREIEVTVVATALATSTVAPASSTPTTEMLTPDDVPAISETISPVTITPQPAEPQEDSFEQGSIVEEVDFTTFNEVWQLVEEEFDGELPDSQELLYTAISGSLEALDDEYTRYVRPEIAERLREDMSGSFSGIGSFVRENEDGLLEIVRPFDGQPADLAGLLAGDVVIAVDNVSVINANFDEVLMGIRGPEGTPVTLTILRSGEDEPLEFTIVRKLIEIPIVESEIFGEEGSKIGYVRLTRFSSNASDAVFDAINGILAEDPEGLIFDLRDNGGGFLDQAVSVADIFLPESVILFERGTQGIDETFRADSGDLGENIPLVVLINAGSASASEIVAGAVKDSGRGILIGETSFGKGSVQLVHTLSDGSQLRVTIARWYTPSNRSISDAGIDPDIEIPTPPDLGGEDDTQIQRAIDYLLNER